VQKKGSEREGVEEPQDQTETSHTGRNHEKGSLRLPEKERANMSPKKKTKKKKKKRRNCFLCPHRLHEGDSGRRPKPSKSRLGGKREKKAEGDQAYIAWKLALIRCGWLILPPRGGGGGWGGGGGGLGGGGVFWGGGGFLHWS